MQQTSITTNASAATTAQEPYFLLVHPKKNEYAPTSKPPRFIPKHEEKFSTIDMGTLKISKEQKRNVPDRISIGSTSFDVNAIDDAKPWPNGREALRMTDEDAATYRDMLALHEAERKQRELDRLEFRKAAASRARRVCKSDCTNL